MPGTRKSKSVLNASGAQKRSKASEDSRVDRPWGAYTSLHRGKNFQVKLITVEPGKRLSLQSHGQRDEHWTIVNGTARVTKGESSFEIGQNETVRIPRTVVHRIENVGAEPLVFVEVQCGDYLGEDDIVRLEDDYGRAPREGA